MQTKWRLDELRDAIRRNHLQGATEAIDFLDSIDRSTLLLSYHSVSARDALNAFVDSEDPTAQKNLELVFGVSKDQDEYAYAKICQEAHLIGAVHTVRGMLDIFGQLVNRLLLQGQIPVHVCSIQLVHDKLFPCALREKLQGLLESDQFKYITGFINTTKHRRLIQHAFSVSFQENRVGIRVGSFSFNGQPFSQRWGIDLLQDAAAIHNRVIDCGRALNAQLRLANV